MEFHYAIDKAGGIVYENVMVIAMRFPLCLLSALVAGISVQRGAPGSK